MKKRIMCVIVILTIIPSLSACQGGDVSKSGSQGNQELFPSPEISEDTTLEAGQNLLSATDEIIKLEKGLSLTQYTDDYMLDTFLVNGGAKSDRDVLDFLMNNLLISEGIVFSVPGFGCSTISVPSGDGEGYYFGRNFDWNKCNALIMVSHPQNGYASISTVNTDFIKQAAGILITDDILKTAAIYAPLDGMNEKGLCASVNMIQDSDTIDQNTDKPDITTTTAIRLLLDKAATVDEAIELLESYDMHASFGYMVHFAIADNTGKSVAVEYIGNKMSVIETPIVTNFYLTEGDKFGYGTSQSHTRFERLEQKLKEMPSMSAENVRDALSSVSKGNFGEFESTEWSVVFNQEMKIASYYHREDYTQDYSVKLDSTGE